MTLGEKIKKLRLEKKLTQSELANKLYVTRQAITNYERDANMPSIDVIKAMANIFEVELSYLLGEEKQEKTKRRLFPLVISSCSILFICIVALITMIIINNNKYYLVGFYFSLNENVTYDINQIEKESYFYDFVITSKNTSDGEYKSNLHYHDIQYIPATLGTLYYYEIYNKIGTDDYKMYLKDQIDTKNRYSFSVEISDKYYGNHMDFVFATPVQEVNIISYNEYGNVIYEETLKMNDNNEIYSDKNIVYEEFDTYRVAGAARYYVCVYSNDVDKYNILSSESIFIFFYDGNSNRYNNYQVLFQV